MPLALVTAALGCAGVHRGPTREVAVPAEAKASPPAAEVAPAVPERSADPAVGVFHVVERGQTLWRISRVYGVGVDELARVNALQDAAALEVGQRLFIPGAHEVLRVDAIESPSAFRTAGDWVWPVAAGRILSTFGAPRHNRRHAGIDIRGTQGQPVLAAREGQVVYSGSSMRGYGKTIILDHGGGLTTLYAHNSLLLVGQGQHVHAGEAIARVGRSGNASTEHCHFEVRRDDRPVDPLIYLVNNPEARR